MKRIIFSLLLITSFLFSIQMEVLAQRLRAFPEAEGFGAYATGGRGGRVVYVTHLDDVLSETSSKYEGSFRAALNTSGSDPITVVFKCGGVIKLTSQITTNRRNMTIAGQTALGDGICISQYGVRFTGDNVIVRHLRFRVGDEINQNDPAMGFGNAKNAIFDHCSFSWSVEENVNITDVDSISLQWCINSESLYYSTHAKGNRAYAAQWGGQRASYHHNLLAHHNSRMPRQNGNTANDYQLTWDYRNNVHYNWRSSGAFYGGGVEQSGGYSHSNLVNNYYIPGPATTTSESSQYFCAPSGGRPAVTGENDIYKYGYGLWWLNGNVMKDNDSKTNDNWLGVDPEKDSVPVSRHQASEEFFIPIDFTVITTSAEVALDDVFANAGATLPRRDSIDRRIVNEAKTQTAAFGGIIGSGKGIIDSHTGTKPDGVKNADFNAWSSYYVDITPLTENKYKRQQVIVYKAASGATSRKYLINDTISIKSRQDSDEDGMPDAWELANGLNPNDAEDRNNVDLVSGYTMLEVYLNSIDGSEDVYNGDGGSTGISKEEAQPHLRIYPNPATSYFNIETILEPKIVEIYTLNGMRVASFSTNGQRTFSISPLQKGIYFVKVTFENGKSTTQRMMK